MMMVEIGGKSQEPLWEAWNTDGDEEDHHSVCEFPKFRLCLVATEPITYWVLSRITFLQLSHATLGVLSCFLSYIFDLFINIL